MKNVLISSAALAIVLAAGMASAQVDGRLVGNRGNASPAKNGWVYFNNGGSAAADINNGGTRPAYIDTATHDTRDCSYNKVTGNLIITEDDGNRLIVLNGANGTYVREFGTFLGTTNDAVDPFRVAVSDDGVIFVNDFARNVAYFADDSGTAAQTNLVDGTTVNGNTGVSRAIHVTGNVGAGTARLFISTGTNIAVFNISGTLPASLVATPLTTTTFAAADGITEAPGITGDMNLVLVSENAANARAAYEVNAGGDTIVGTLDDTYVSNQTIADNQVGQAFVCGSNSALTDSAIDLLPANGTNTPGAYAFFDCGGAFDGVVVGSLGTATTPGTIISPVDAAEGTVLNESSVAIVEDHATDNDSGWDGNLTNFNGNSADGGADLVVINNEVFVYFVSGGNNATTGLGSVGRLVVPGSVGGSSSIANWATFD